MASGPAEKAARKRENALRGTKKPKEALPWQTAHPR
jgi:hypothetical protein